MTTVVVYAAQHADQAVTLMAADRCTNVYDRPVLGVSKIIRCATTSGDGSYLLGFSGEGAGPSVVRSNHSVKVLPNFDDKRDRDNWAAAVAVAITQIYLEHGFVEGSRMDSNVVLAARGHVWTITHHQAIAHLDGMAAIGSGEGPALGALHALIETGVSPREAIVRACRIGIGLDRYSAGRPLLLSA